MFDFLEFSLDVATALSIIGAAATFFVQQRRQKRADQENAKWTFLKELADDFAQYKARIVKAIVDKHGLLIDADVVYQSDNWRNTAWNDMLSLQTEVNRTITDAYYYVEYDLRKKAEAIAGHFEDPQMGISDQIESFLKATEAPSDRLEKSIGVAHCSNLQLKTYYVEVFLRDVGFRTQGSDVRNFPVGEEIDEFWTEVRELTGYVPRRHIRREELPSTVLEVLNDFSDAMLNTIKK